MAKINSFKDLEIWQLARELAVKVYRLTDTFPKEERFGLVDQCRRAIVSVVGNIAEGFGRYFFKDNIRFQYNSRGSLYEVESHLLTSEALGYINEENRELYEEILRDITRLGVKINNFINSLSKKTKRKTT